MSTNLTLELDQYFNEAINLLENVPIQDILKPNDQIQFNLKHLAKQTLPYPSPENSPSSSSSSLFLQPFLISPLIFSPGFLNQLSHLYLE